MTSRLSGTFWPDDFHRVTSRLVLVGCSKEKAPEPGPLPAFELYDGGCVPPMRERLGKHPELRSRIQFLSAEHGLVSADSPLYAYDRPLDPARAVELRPAVMSAVRRELAANGVPADVLIV